MLNVVVNQPEEPRRTPTLKLEELHTDYLAIFKTQSFSRQTGGMMNEILRQLENIPNLIKEYDNYGNLYVTKGKIAKDETCPIYVSHIDTVHKIYDVPVRINISEGGNIFGYIEKDGEFQQIGVGGDDKCGIIACIEMLNRLKKVKCAFFLDEEVGCLGSNAGDLTFFENGRFAIQVDRKGNGDIITNGSGTELCSPEFKNLLNECGKVYGYKSTTGMMTDVVTLKKRGMGISSVNLSAGYFNPHTKQEYVNVLDLLNCLEFCLAISKFKTVFPHVLPKPVYKEVSKSTYNNYNGYPASNGVPMARGVPSKNVTVGGFAPRKCVDCGHALTEAEGKVCTRCMENWFNESFIEVNDDETITLTSFDDIVLEGYEGWLPSEFCIPCKIENDKTMVLLYSEKMKERGYCASCESCSTPKCDRKLSTGYEILEKHCVSHLDMPSPTDVVPMGALGEATEDTMDAEYCKTIQCMNFLMSAQEQMGGYCNNCKEGND